MAWGGVEGVELPIKEEVEGINSPVEEEVQGVGLSIEEEVGSWLSSSIFLTFPCMSRVIFCLVLVF